MENSNGIRDLQYYIFSGESCRNSEMKLQQKTLSFWQSKWQKVFEHINPNYCLEVEDFYSQKKVCVIVNEEQVVAIQTLGEFNMTDFLYLPYFKNYTVEFLQYLVQCQVKKFQTMHYFLVNEDFGPRQTGQNFAAIILGLSFRNQKMSNLDATITLARKDLAAASTAKKFDMNQVGEDIKMHNVPVGQLLCLEPTLYPRHEVNQAVDYLWNTRIDLTINNNNKERENDKLGINF